MSFKGFLKKLARVVFKTTSGISRTFPGDIRELPVNSLYSRLSNITYLLSTNVLLKTGHISTLARKEHLDFTKFSMLPSTQAVVHLSVETSLGTRQFTLHTGVMRDPKYYTISMYDSERILFSLDADKNKTTYIQSTMSAEEIDLAIHELINILKESRNEMENVSCRS